MVPITEIGEPIVALHHDMKPVSVEYKCNKRRAIDIKIVKHLAKHMHRARRERVKCCPAVIAHTTENTVERRILRLEHLCVVAVDMYVSYIPGLHRQRLVDMLFAPKRHPGVKLSRLFILIRPHEIPEHKLASLHTDALDQRHCNLGVQKTEPMTVRGSSYHTILFRDIQRIVERKHPVQIVIARQLVERNNPKLGEVLLRSLP